jgi:hypothetical protein
MIWMYVRQAGHLAEVLPGVLNLLHIFQNVARIATHEPEEVDEFS